MIDEVVTCKVLADSGKSANGRRLTSEESKSLRGVIRVIAAGMRRRSKLSGLRGIHVGTEYSCAVNDARQVFCLFEGD